MLNPSCISVISKMLGNHLEQQAKMLHVLDKFLKSSTSHIRVVRSGYRVFPIVFIGTYILRK